MTVDDYIPVDNSRSDPPPRTAEQACRSSEVGAKTRLVLRNVSHPPETRSKVGAEVVVTSSYHGSEMAFATAHAARAACEPSQHRDSEGDATVAYKLIRVGRVRFESGLAHVTNAADPAMPGYVVVYS